MQNNFLGYAPKDIRKRLVIRDEHPEKILEKINSFALINAAFNPEIVDSELLDGRKYIIEIDESGSLPEVKIKLLDNGKEKEALLPGFYLGNEKKEELNLDGVIKRGIKYLENQIITLEKPMRIHNYTIGQIIDTEDFEINKKNGMQPYLRFVIQRKPTQKESVPISALDTIIPILLNEKVSTARKKQKLTSLACDIATRYRGTAQIMETILRMAKAADFAECEPVLMSATPTKRIYVPSQSKIKTEDESMRRLQLIRAYDNTWTSELCDTLM
ncbi:hypothetical protein GF358_04670, partial [Candidatus Woesearchaeota archaeon]|nr:hypothetical protein [Candidatus Woesearchaeota archaeon]